MSWESRGVKGELLAINVSPQEQCSYTAPVTPAPPAQRVFFFFFPFSFFPIRVQPDALVSNYHMWRGIKSVTGLLGIRARVSLDREELKRLDHKNIPSGKM